jgi:threonine/homoserine/homoserine lactone efflux protein
MLDAIGQVLPLAVVVALSPAPIIAIIVVLLGADAGRRGAALLAGRVLGVVLVVAVFTLFAEAIVLLGMPPLLEAILQLVVGLVLAIIGVRKLVRRAVTTTSPRWMTSLEGISAGRAFWFAVALSIANPKELAMGAATGLVIGGLIPEPGPALAVALVYTVIAVLGVAVPLVTVAVMRERAAHVLTAIRGWLERNNAVLMAIVLLVFGAILLGRGVSGLA